MRILSHIFIFFFLFVGSIYQAEAQKVYLDIHIEQPDTLRIEDSTITEATCPEINDGSISVSLSGGTFPFNYQWENGNTGSFIQELYPGFYILTITDDQNCSLRDTFRVGIKRASCLKDITAFTPNGDGKNDVWNIPGLKMQFPEAEVYIYNRRGDLLHKAKASESGSDKGLWDGRYKGRRLPTDSYHFIIISGDKVIKKGHVTLLRNR